MFRRKKTDPLVHNGHAAQEALEQARKDLVVAIKRKREVDRLVAGVRREFGAR